MLNNEQLELKAKIEDFLLNNKRFGYFGVYGAGGTGKTYTICRTLDNYSGKVLFLGATNKVCTVLKNSLQASGFKDPKIKTIDSYFRFRIIKDHENNSKIVHTFPAKNEIPDLIIIDEVSMVTKQKFDLIEKLKEKCKIILIGDFLQLPPIEENKNNMVRNKDGFLISSIFNAVPDTQTFTLTIQNRQKDGTQLSQLLKDFRANMHLKIPAIKLAEKKNNGIDILYFPEINKDLKDFIKNNNCVAVCYKNLSVLNFNWLIGSTKSMRKDYRLNEINKGDTLMFDAFYFHELNMKKTSFYTSNIVTVTDIQKNVEEVFTIKNGMNKIVTFNVLTVTDEDGKTHKIRYIFGGLYGANGGGLSQSVYGQRKTYTEHIRSGKNVQENIKYLTDLNTRFADYQNSFAKLKRPYAITAHKAQGSTYQNVIIPVYDYYNVKHQDTNQLLYVALSRAKEKVIFVNKKETFDETTKRKMFSEFEKQSIASMQDYKCKKCNTNLDDREFDIDHEVPISMGGQNKIENLQALCKPCHKKKCIFEKQNKMY